MIYPLEKQFTDSFVRFLDGQGEHFQGANGFAVKTITFVVTEDCNLRCSYCYECNKNYSTAMTKETARKAVDTLLSQNTIHDYIDPSGDVRAIILDFIGGEPLLQIELIDYICDYFKYQVYTRNHQFQNYMFSISTNGVLYDTPEVQKFIFKNRGRLSLSITIDGNKELHDSCRLFPDGAGSFDTVFRNVQKAVEQIGLQSTKVTIAPENLKYLSTSIPWLIEQGLRDIHANCVYEDVWKPEHAMLFYSELIKLADWLLDDKRYERCGASLFAEFIGKPLSQEDNHNWCGGTGLMLAIGTDGNLYPCIRYMQYSLRNQSELKIGNIDSGITEFQVIDRLSAITRRSQSTDECFNCPAASGCAWCSGYCYDVHGTPDKRTTFICQMHKARVLANYYYWNSVYALENMDKRFELYLSREDVDFITGGQPIKRRKNIL
ncbi:MAG: radical SAM peptide maturase, CXXX-repeat target family [Clostridiales bacterium]|jgi:uncharacterized protein|nr:radical SAM peptide maturase, CXXX-repeat target family [Clostridiales bacterium]